MEYPKNLEPIMKFYWICILLHFCLVGVSAQQIYVINSVDDTDDGVCDSDHCSLREAINAANKDNEASILWFEITGAIGQKVIRLTTPLPPITDEQLTIEGTTQPGNFPAAGLVVIDGNNRADDCLIITGGDLRVMGLQFQNFPGAVIKAINENTSQWMSLSVGEYQKRNYFLSNGTVLDVQNVARLRFYNNYVGTNQNFDSGLGNQAGIILQNDMDSDLDAEIRIGGWISEGRGNVFAATRETAVDVTYHGNCKIEGNIFGTGVTGTEQLGNNRAVHVETWRGNIDIGGRYDTRNIFAYNQEAVIVDRNNFVRVSENQFYCNFISLRINENAQPTPVIDQQYRDRIEGTATPGDYVELYLADDEKNCNSGDCQGKKYLGTVQADNLGKFVFNRRFEYGQKFVLLALKGGQQSEFSECLSFCPPPVPVAIESNAPLCMGDSLHLSAEVSYEDIQWYRPADEFDVSYHWEGPEGFYSEKKQLVRASVAGAYIFQASVLGCNTRADTVEVAVNRIAVEVPEQLAFCRATEMKLEVNFSSTTAGLPTYSWQGPNGFTSSISRPIVSEAGVYEVIVSQNGCVSTPQELTLINHHPSAPELEDQTLCEGESVTFLASGYDSYQWETDLPVDCNDCESVVIAPENDGGKVQLIVESGQQCYDTSTVDIKVNQRIEISESLSFCAGTTLDLHGELVAEPGIYSRTYTSATGCDSVHTFIVYQNQEVTVSEVQTLCEGEVLEFGGDTYASAGIYTKIFQAQNGCDSIHTVALEFHSADDVQEQITLCAGETTVVFGEPVSQSGVFTQSFTAANGCPAIHTVDVTVLPENKEEETITVCEGEPVTLFDGEIVQAATSEIFTRTFTAKNGCDSVHTIRVEVAPTAASSEYITLCASAAREKFGATAVFPRTERQDWQTSVGCDSIHTITWLVAPEYELEQQVTICEGATYTAHGQSVQQSGTYSQSFISEQGCDSVHTIHLTVLPNKSSNELIRACEGEVVQVFGKTVTVSGVFSENFTSRSGCDSMHTVEVIFEKTQLIEETLFLCDGENALIFEDSLVSESGVYEQTWTSTGGCDSTRRITVFVREQLQTFETVTICDIDETATPPPAEEYVFTSVSGCDSTHTVHYTIIPSYQAEEVVTICAGEAYQIHGNRQSEPGIYTTTFSSISGCDSVHTVVLKVADHQAQSRQIVACEGEVVDVFGQEVTESGIFSKNYVSAAGCDSVFTIEVVFAKEKATSQSIVLCEGEQAAVFGEIVREEGVWSKTFAATNGCDSTHTISVRVNQPVFITEKLKLCEAACAAQFGATVCASGQLVSRHLSQSGCDSIHTLQLEVLEQDVVIEHIALCGGDSMLIQGTYQKGSGEFTQHYANAYGCDSVHTVVLEVSEPISGDLDITHSCHFEANGKIDLNLTGGTAPYTLSWEQNSTNRTETIADLEAADYYLTVTDAQGCEWEVSASVDAIQPPTLQEDIQPVSCAGDADGMIILQADQELIYEMEGYPATDFGEFLDLSAGTYPLKVKDENGCEYFYEWKITEPEPITVNLPELYQITLGDSAKLIPQTGVGQPVTYKWQTEFGNLNCQDCPVPMARPQQDAWVTLEVWDKNQCSATTETFIRVDTKGEVFIPNTFTPDGDDKNDFHVIYAKPEQVERVEEYLVFSRWGDLLYEAYDFLPNDELYGWDGTQNGKPLNSGVFVYRAVIRLKNGSLKHLSGDVTLLRR